MTGQESLSEKPNQDKPPVGIINPPTSRIEKLPIEIEEIALGVHPGDKPQELLVSKAKKIQQLARRRRETKIVGTVAALVCQKCDLRMVEESVTGKYRIFECGNCGIMVGILKP